MKYGLPENEELKKELERIDSNFRLSVADLIACAIIVVIVIVKYFPFE
jgi:hypothetical protein